MKTSTDCPQITARVSPAKKALLKDLASVQRATQTEILERALDLYAASLNASEKKVLLALSAVNPGRGEAPPVARQGQREVDCALLAGDLPGVRAA